MNYVALAMAKTIGAHVASPSARNPRPRASPTRDSTSEALQASIIPHSEGGVQSRPPQCRNETRRPPTTLGASTSRPNKLVYRLPTKKARVSGPRESSAPPQPQPPTTEPFHSELCLIWRRSDNSQSLEIHSTYCREYHMEHLMTPRDFLHIAEALHIPYEPEGASTWDAPSRCGAALQHISTSAYGADEMSYIRGFIPDIRGFLLWPSSFDYDLSSPL
ncbi:hypothetical protein CK203_108796 [Vitis vinifera]|uniref:Uncharacterized protein n=1 Tax=Vitis vinifera TaxID=29760 RepID=A0A438BP74_VITVI|nr:hypothetical protein CK203_108796 [Vitis vinifera]